MQYHVKLVCPTNLNLEAGGFKSSDVLLSIFGCMVPEVSKKPSVFIFSDNDPRKKHLKTKRRTLYLKTQSVPRCKHFSSGL